MSSNLLTSSRSCIPPLSFSLAVGSTALTLARPCGCSSAVSVNSRLNFSCSTTFVSLGARSAAADNAGAHQFALFGLSYGTFIQKPLFYCLSYLFYTKKKYSLWLAVPLLPCWQMLLLVKYTKINNSQGEGSTELSEFILPLECHSHLF